LWTDSLRCSNVDKEKVPVASEFSLDAVNASARYASGYIQDQAKYVLLKNIAPNQLRSAFDKFEVRFSLSRSRIASDSRLRDER
jgi:hypothetical protein